MVRRLVLDPVGLDSPVRSRDQGMSELLTAEPTRLTFC